jgi:hypothetical protein
VVSLTARQTPSSSTTQVVEWHSEVNVNGVRLHARLELSLVGMLLELLVVWGHWTLLVTVCSFGFVCGGWWIARDVHTSYGRVFTAAPKNISVRFG